MEVWVSVYLIIIIIIRPDIAINELMGRKAIFNQYSTCSTRSKSVFTVCARYSTRGRYVLLLLHNDIYLYMIIVVNVDNILFIVTCMKLI